MSRRTRNLRRVYDLGAKRRIQTRTFAYGNRRSRIFRRKRRKIDYKSDNYVNPDSIPEHVKAAFVALEDKRFYSHQGYDVKGIIRAVATNIKAGGTVEGASTITQQLVKNTHLSSEKTLSRKLNEIAIAMKIEKNTPKTRFWRCICPSFTSAAALTA